MNFDDIAKMTTQERRDWLARDEGWGLPGDRAVCMDGTTGTLTSFARFAPFPSGLTEPQRPRQVQKEHPIPDTLDAAAKALPEGWLWSRELMFNGTIHWVIRRWDGDQLRALKLSDTGDEKHARFGLAIAARMAMKKGAHP
jgi:hypothetical protein